MDLVSYGCERLIDVTAALIFRLGVRLVNRLFVNGSTSVGGRDTGGAGEPGEEVESGVGSGSGASLVATAGAGSSAGASIGGLRGDFVVSVAEADVVGGATAGGRPGSCVVDGFEIARF